MIEKLSVLMSSNNDIVAKINELIDATNQIPPMVYQVDVTDMDKTADVIEVLTCVRDTIKAQSPDLKACFFAKVGDGGITSSAYKDFIVNLSKEERDALINALQDE